MKSLSNYVRSCGGEGAGAPGGSDTPRAKGQADPTVGLVKRVAGKGLWRDVEFVPKIVEKIGE